MEIIEKHIGKTNIIEIIGPPGVGKSTIYKALCNKWNKQSNWIDQAQLLAAKKPGIKNLKQFVEFEFRKLLNKQTNRSIPIDYALRFMQENEALTSFLWSYISSDTPYEPADNAGRFRSAYFLFKDFSRYQAIWQTKHHLPCIIDEGLLEKSFFVIGEISTMKRIVSEYIDLLRLPAAVIYITASTSEIVGRLKARTKTIASHLGKSPEELTSNIDQWKHLLDEITKQLEKRNVPVFIVDGLRPVAENVRLLQNKLEAGIESSRHQNNLLFK